MKRNRFFYNFPRNHCFCDIFWLGLALNCLLSSLFWSLQMTLLHCGWGCWMLDVQFNSELFFLNLFAFFTRIGAFFLLSEQLFETFSRASQLKTPKLDSKTVTARSKFDFLNKLLIKRWCVVVKKINLAWIDQTSLKRTRNT